MRPETTTPERELDGILISAQGDREIMGRPPRKQASRKLIHMLEDALDECQTTEALGDWLADLLERVGATSSRPIFTMDGGGPLCSWCGAIWPLCGHHHMSYAPEVTEEDGNTEENES